MLPTDAKARKAVPIFSGFIKYFPDAIAAVAELSRIGNDQHNPGAPLGWDRSKSGDEMDALCRHMLDMAAGVDEDSDGVLHATKQAWRAMAHLQKTIEKRTTKTDEKLVKRSRVPWIVDSRDHRFCGDCRHGRTMPFAPECQGCIAHPEFKVNFAEK